MKLKVLQTVEKSNEVTAKNLAKILKISHSNASMALLRARRQGLVKRKRYWGKEFCYFITPKGKNRINYLLKNQEKISK